MFVKAETWFYEKETYMAIVAVPKDTATVVSSGTANDLAICNAGSGIMALNTTDPSTAGALVYLGPKDTVVMSAGSAWAAAQWVAYTKIGGQVSVVEV